ncbi:MAG: hypothetical protein U1F53_09565 [Burkholderiaceae bacterium]
MKHTPLACGRAAATRLLAAAALCAALGPAAAQSGGYGSTGPADNNAYSVLPYTQRGYVGLNLGQGHLDLGCGSGLYRCEKNSDLSMSLYTGGMFNDWVGLEFGYFHAGQVERAGGHSDAQGLDLRLVGRWQAGSFNVFVKGGVVYGRTRVTAAALSGVDDGRVWSAGPAYGAGLGFDFNRHSGVVLEWSRDRLKFPSTDRENVDGASLGYVYKF